MSSEIAPGTYHIKHPKSGMFVVPRTWQETVSPLCLVHLNDPAFPQLSYVWSFIEIEPNLFRIVNEKTRLCVQIKHGGTPPAAGESVHQNTCESPGADERWYYRAGRFECFLNPALMWEAVDQGGPYLMIDANPAHGLDSEWVLVTVTPSDEEAKGTAA
jgi:hypothetical protein